jgi:hypothetical protein
MIILIIIILNEFFKKESTCFLNSIFVSQYNTPIDFVFKCFFTDGQTDRRTDTRSTQKYSTRPHKNGEANFTHEWPKANFTHVSKRTLHTILRCELYTRF